MASCFPVDIRQGALTTKSMQDLVCCKEEQISENYNESTDKECSDYANAGYRLGL